MVPPLSLQTASQRLFSCRTCPQVSLPILPELQELALLLSALLASLLPQLALASQEFDLRVSPEPLPLVSPGLALSVWPGLVP